jgi:hypothetical protein
VVKAKITENEQHNDNNTNEVKYPIHPFSPSKRIVRALYASAPRCDSNPAMLRSIR